MIDFAMISVAVLVRGDGGGACRGADVVLGSVGPVPWRATDVEAALQGARLEAAQITEAARATRLGADTPSDVHADAAYRREVAPVCVQRALEAAVARMHTGR
jgi:carbon-monoxide dehydrogenase medium subunit